MFKSKHTKIEGVLKSERLRISNPKGDITRILRSNEDMFDLFGEVYMSSIKSDEVKGWKRHRGMACNLFVAKGSVEFNLFDERKNSPTNGVYESIEIDDVNPILLTIPRNIWFAFKCTSKETALIINVTNDYAENDITDNVPIGTFNFG